MTSIILYACVWLFGVGIGILIGDGCLEKRKWRRAIMESWPSVPGRRAVRALKDSRCRRRTATRTRRGRSLSCVYTPVPHVELPDTEADELDALRDDAVPEGTVPLSTVVAACRYSGDS